MRLSRLLRTKFRDITGVIKSTCHSKMTTPVVYHSLDTVLNVLKSKLTQDKAEAVQELLSIYDEYTTSASPHEEGKHPVIVIEGLDAVGKTTITNRLIKLMDAELLTTPPQCVKHIRDIFDDDLHLRTAYYSLGIYIAEAQITQARKSKPVIVDRYWHSTAAYALAEAAKSGVLDLPSSGNRIYEWPSDLLKPDLVLYLWVSESERQRRHAARNTTNTMQEQELQSNDVFRANLIEAYRNMTNPSVQEIKAEGAVEEIVERIIEKTKYLFKKVHN